MLLGEGVCRERCGIIWGVMAIRGNFGSHPMHSIIPFPLLPNHLVAAGRLNALVWRYMGGIQRVRGCIFWNNRWGVWGRRGVHCVRAISNTMDSIALCSLGCWEASGWGLLFAAAATALML